MKIYRMIHCRLMSDYSDRRVTCRPTRVSARVCQRDMLNA